MRGRRAIFAFVVVVALALVRATLAAPFYVVIVHPNNPVSGVDRKFLSDAFLKKTTRWDNGEVIKPVDQAADSPVRKKFCEDVLKRSVAAVRSYWQQIIFAGRDVPPPELPGDDEVVKYVLKYPGSVGYVSGAANLNGAKIISVD